MAFFERLSGMFTSFIYKGAQFMRRRGYNFHETSDPRVREMQRKIAELGAVQFKVDVESETGNWVAESTNIDGIITGGRKYPSEVNEAIKDAIFTYFEIPPHLCNDELLQGENEHATVTEERRVYATN